MDTGQIIAIVSSVAAISALIFTTYTMLLLRRESRYDRKENRAELEMMRASLEKRVYDANERLMKTFERWNDVNHLIVEAQKNVSQSPQGSTSSNRFLNAMGIDGEIKINPRQVFVLTPFHDDFDATFETIAMVCRDVGLICLRGDEEFIEGAILKHIIKQIASSRLIIANIDGRNPNVYYELGIAHAMGKSVLLVASDIESVPFDLKSQRIVLYQSDASLANGLKGALTQLMIDGAG